jgi:hypothetical protein
MIRELSGLLRRQREAAAGWWVAGRETIAHKLIRNELSVEKAIHGLFSLGRHPKLKFLWVANRRAMRRKAFFTAC